MEASKIAAAVQAGQADRMELWEAVRRFAYDRVYRWCRAMEGRGGMVLEDYIKQMEALVDAGTFDVLGHIIYPLRYFSPNLHLSLDPWQEQLDEILRRVIHSGKGIEFNTTQGTTIRQWAPLLTRYRELGGEILTLGSDAHRPQFIGAGFQEAAQMLQHLGYRYVCTYRQRTPQFHPLG